MSILKCINVCIDVYMNGFRTQLSFHVYTWAYIRCSNLQRENVGVETLSRIACMICV